MKQKAKRKGFTLIDVIIAIALVGIATLAVGLIYPGLRLSELSREQIIANSVAQKKMEELKAVQFDSLVLESGVPFADAELIKLKNSSASYTVSEYDINGDLSGDDDVRLITVTVIWQNLYGLKNYTLTSTSSLYGLAQ